MRKIGHYEARWRERRQGTTEVSADPPVVTPNVETPEIVPSIPSVDDRAPIARVEDSSAESIHPAVEIRAEDPSADEVTPEDSSTNVSPSASEDDVRGDDGEETADDEPEEATPVAPGEAPITPSERRRRRRRDRGRRGGAAPAA